MPRTGRSGDMDRVIGGWNGAGTGFLKSHSPSHPPWRQNMTGTRRVGDPHHHVHSSPAPTKGVARSSESLKGMFSSVTVRPWRPPVLRPGSGWGMVFLNVYLFFCFIEQLLSRATDLSLLTIPAGQLSSHKGIAEKTQNEEGNYEDEDR